MRSNSSKSKFPKQQTAVRKHNCLILIFTAVTFTILLPAVVRAQQGSSSPQSSVPSTAQSPAPAPAAISIPADTRIELVLTQAVDSREMHHGDQIHAQITNPVIAQNRGVIPPGSFLQGEIKKLAASHNRAEILLESASIIFPDGGVLAIPGPLTIESGEYTAWRNPSEAKRGVAFLMPLVGGGLGTLIGSRFHTTQTIGSGPTSLIATSTSMKALAVGSTVGLGAGLAAMALLLHTHHFYLAEGSPMELRLSTALTVPSAEVAPAGAPAMGHGMENRQLAGFSSIEQSITPPW